MAQAKKPVAQSGGAGQPPWQRYWNYLPFPLSWIVLAYVVATILTVAVLAIANM